MSHHQSTSYEVLTHSGWTAIDLPLPSEAQLNAENADYQRIQDEGIIDPSGEGDEYNGAYDEQYIKQTSIQEQEQEQEPIIHYARSQPRMSETEELAFDISYDDGVQWSRVPITSFFDLKDNTVIYEEITHIINDMRKVASNFPSRNRKCICCHRKAVSGEILCRSCKPTYHALVIA